MLLKNSWMYEPGESGVPAPKWYHYDNDHVKSWDLAEEQKGALGFCHYKMLIEWEVKRQIDGRVVMLETVLAIVLSLRLETLAWDYFGDVFWVESMAQQSECVAQESECMM